MKITKEKVGLILIALALTTSPLTGQYVQLGIELLFSQLFLYGAYVGLVAGIYTAGLLFWYMWDSREKTNIPAKGKTTHKAGKFLEA